MTEYLFETAVSLISSLGYGGVFFLMMLESMITPVPSEAVMPFAGALWAMGNMSPVAIALASTMGSIVGSLLSYAIGYYGGRPLITRFGSYLLFSEDDLNRAEKFFARHGGGAIFLARFIPIVRHGISIPAGAARMRLAPFIFYTAAGAGIWNMILAYGGYRLGPHLGAAGEYNTVVDVAVLIIILGIAVHWYARRRNTRLLLATQKIVGDNTMYE